YGFKVRTVVNELNRGRRGEERDVRHPVESDAVYDELKGDDLIVLYIADIEQNRSVGNSLSRLEISTGTGDRYKTDCNQNKENRDLMVLRTKFFHNESCKSVSK